ncbi:MAG TPA: right-handed parallel beta-helix repeat-containing protein [Nitrososphaera sp.]|nr:right-handed parallel beta-helix repeat-containing protein [Nitrososphaera sp.]
MVEILCDADIYELFSGLRHDSITQQLGSGQILINANITVNEDATFSINPDGGINYVKIAGNSGITVHGAIHIDAVKITSWDPANNAVVEQDATGSVPRGYLFLSGSQGSHIFNSELGYMGHNATGYRGVDLLAGSHDFTVANSSFHDMWYAFYSNGAYNVTIDSSEYRDNDLYAIDPHTGTHNVTISNNTLHGNPVGLVCSLDCYDIIFEGNTIYNNSGPGIFFSRNTHDSVARYNTIYDQPVGIAFSESRDNEAYGNSITSTGRGVFFTNPENRDDGNTTNNRVYNNTISNSAVGIAAFRTADNIATSNNFHNITMSHYRLNASSALTIDSQTFENATIEGQDGENVVNIANSGIIQVDGDMYDASLQHTVMLSNQTITVSSTPMGSLRTAAPSNPDSNPLYLRP